MAQRAVVRRLLCIFVKLRTLMEEHDCDALSNCLM